METARPPCKETACCNTTDTVQTRTKPENRMHGDLCPESPAVSPVVVRISLCSQRCRNKGGDCPATLQGNSLLRHNRYCPDQKSRPEFSLRVGWVHYLVLQQQSRHLGGYICSAHWNHDALRKPSSWQEHATPGFRTRRYVDAKLSTG